jgi:hypothetical protein
MLSGFLKKWFQPIAPNDSSEYLPERKSWELKPGDRVFVGIAQGSATIESIAVDRVMGTATIVWDDKYDRRRLISVFNSKEKFFIHSVSAEF